MNRDRIAYLAATGTPWALGGGCWWMASFFDDPNPAVALTALAGWACLLVAIYKTPKPRRRPKE